MTNLFGKSGGLLTVSLPFSEKLPQMLQLSRELVALLLPFHCLLIQE